MKIVFFDFATLNYAGGCEKNFMKFGKWLRKRGYNTFFVTGSNKINNQYCSLAKIGEHKKNISDSGLKTDFGVDKYYTFDLKDLIFPTKNRKKIKKILNESDAVYSKNEIFELLILKFVFKLKSEKIVFGIHTPIHYPISNSWKSKLHNLVYNSIIYSWLIGKSRCRVLNKEQRDDLKRLNKNIKLSVIPNPLDTKFFYQKEYKKSEKFKIYYIGRMTEQKGIDTLYEAIILLSKEEIFNNLEFFFVGGGDQQHYLKDLSDKFSNCHFLGFRQDVIKFYQNADIVVAPSRWESYCYSVAEAQSCGVPVIVTDIPGPKDLMIDKKTGFLIEAVNEKDLKKKILEIFYIWQKNYSNYVMIGKRARINIIKNFEQNMINKRIESFLNIKRGKK